MHRTSKSTTSLPKQHHHHFECVHHFWSELSKQLEDPSIHSRLRLGIQLEPAVRCSPVDRKSRGTAIDSEMVHGRSLNKTIVGVGRHQWPIFWLQDWFCTPWEAHDWAHCWFGGLVQPQQPTLSIWLTPWWTKFGWGQRLAWQLG